MISSLLPPSIDIDYTANYRQLYQQLALIWIDKPLMTLDVLIFTGEEGRDTQLPSRVPDWTAPAEAMHESE
jgi:hypothetical protein